MHSPGCSIDDLLRGFFPFLPYLQLPHFLPYFWALYYSLILFRVSRSVYPEWVTSLRFIAALSIHFAPYVLYWSPRDKLSLCRCTRITDSFRQLKWSFSPFNHCNNARRVQSRLFSLMPWRGIPYTLSFACNYTFSSPSRHFSLLYAVIKNAYAFIIIKLTEWVDRIEQLITYFGRIVIMEDVFLVLHTISGWLALPVGSSPTHH